MEGCFTFQWGGVFVFQMGGFIFKWGVHPMAGIGFDGRGGLKKIVGWGVAPPLWETLQRESKNCRQRRKV